MAPSRPDFTLKDQNNQDVSLSDFRGKKNVLIVFYPLAFTGTCQGELCEVRDDLPKFENDDAAILAISRRPAAHAQDLGGASRATRSRCCPTSGRTARSPQAYGVFNERAGFANRGTFVVDKEGVIRFAEMNGPGEARDQAAWEKALATLASV